MLKKVQRVQSKVTKAIVYRTGAYVTRVAQVHLLQGISSLCFDNLSESMVGETFQVLMPTGLSCVQVRYDENCSEYDGTYVLEKKASAVQENARLKSLKERKEEVEDAIAAIEFSSEIISQKLTFAKKDEFSVDELKAYVDYTYMKQTELLKKKRELNKERKSLYQEIGQLEESCKEENTGTRVLFGALFLDVEAEQEGDYTIEITAYEKRVSWNPVYDIRVDNLMLPMSVVLKGKIYQRTGETWENIELIVSNGNLLMANNQPELKDWKLELFSNEIRIPPPPPAPMPMLPSPLPYPSADGDTCCLLAASETSTLETVTLFEKTPKYAIPNKVLENQTNIEYQLSGSYTLSDTKQGNMIEIIRKSVEAEYSHYITPKAECSAYLMAVIKNWRNIEWLECDANIFLENRYVGATHIAPDRMGDLFKISLGRDRSITAKRHRTKRNTSQQILGNMQSKDFEYQFEIRNEKNQPVQIMVIDQIPVTENEKIIVDSVNAPGAELEPKTGRITWRARLNVGEKIFLTLGFRVRWPKGMRINI